MFWPVTSSPRRWAHSDVVAALSPLKVLTSPPRWRSSAAFAVLLCSSVNSQARSQRAVQGHRAVRAVVRPATGAVGAGGGVAHRHQRVADGGQATLDQLAV